MKKLALAAPVVLILLVVGTLLLASKQTTVRIDPAIKALGTDTQVKVSLDNPHGVRQVAAYIEQNNTRYPVFQTSEPASRLMFWRKSVPAKEIVIGAGKKQAPQLQEGKARLVVEAVSNDLRASRSTAATDVIVNTKPPMLVPDGFQHYINQGGAELVMFTVSGYWTEAGVRVGKYTFRSFPVPGKPSTPDRAERFSLFAFPWDVPADTVPIVYARNPAGVEVTGRFWYKVFPKKFRSRELEIDDAFLEKVVNQIDRGGSGDIVQRFLRINGEMRRQNNQTLADLRLQSAEKYLWEGPFMRFGKTESEFADHRTYKYKGKEIDQQTHLGFDLSHTQRSPVQAANSGKVLYASELGIYGNCIVIDHGFGLQSIYGHLSEFSVKVGDMVKKGQEIGKSGATGLAGGDHLHFTMQADGVQITPVEWWDEHWIKDRVLSKVPMQ